MCEFPGLYSTCVAGLRNKADSLLPIQLGRKGTKGPILWFEQRSSNPARAPSSARGRRKGSVVYKALAVTWEPWSLVLALPLADVWTSDKWTLEVVYLKHIATYLNTEALKKW